MTTVEITYRGFVSGILDGLSDDCLVSLFAFVTPKNKKDKLFADELYNEMVARGLKK